MHFNSYCGKLPTRASHSGQLFDSKSSRMFVFRSSICLLKKCSKPLAETHIHRYRLTGAETGKILTTDSIIPSERIIDFFTLQPELEERKNTRPDNLTTFRAVVAVDCIHPGLEKKPTRGDNGMTTDIRFSEFNLCVEIFKISKVLNNLKHFNMRETTNKDYSLQTTH